MCLFYIGGEPGSERCSSMFRVTHLLRGGAGSTVGTSFQNPATGLHVLQHVAARPPTYANGLALVARVPSCQWSRGEGGIRVGQAMSLPVTLTLPTWQRDGVMPFWLLFGLRITRGCTGGTLRKRRALLFGIL